MSKEKIKIAFKRTIQIYAERCITGRMDFDKLYPANLKEVVGEKIEEIKSAPDYDISNVPTT